MNTEINRKPWEVPVLIILYVFSSALFGLDGVVNLLMLVGMLFLNYRKIKISTTEAVLIAFSTVFFVFFTFNVRFHMFYFVVYFLCPWTAYIFGRLYMSKAADDRAFISLLIVLAAGMCTYGLLNLYAYLTSEHYALYDNYRQAVDFWTGKVVNVNTTGMYYTFATGISLGVLFTKTRIRYKLIAAAVLTACIVATIFFASRSLLVIVAIIVAWRLVCFFFEKSVTTRKKIIVAIVLLLVVVVFAICIVANIGGIASAITALKVFDRFTNGENSSRLEVWMLFFEDFNFIKHPFGGSRITEGTQVLYLHNLWLDVYNTAGCIAFILILIFTYDMVKAFIRFRKVMLVHGKRKELTIFECLMIAILMNCAVEPIIEANPYYFEIVLMFLGAMVAYTHRLQQRSEACL